MYAVLDFKDNVKAIFSETPYVSEGFLINPENAKRWDTRYVKLEPAITCLQAYRRFTSEERKAIRDASLRDPINLNVEDFYDQFHISAMQQYPVSLVPGGTWHQGMMYLWAIDILSGPERMLDMVRIEEGDLKALYPDEMYLP